MTDRRGAEFPGFDAFDRMKAEAYNRTVGSLDGYDCQECLNRGRYLVAIPGKGTVVRECRCMAIRRAKQAMKASGVPTAALEHYRFETFQTDETWQKRLLDMAESYAREATENREFSRWLAVTGVPGSGKTHVCTAAFSRIVESGQRGLYLSWRDFARQAKAVANSGEEFARVVNGPKSVSVLYVDDFWKGGATEADVRLAFEVLNTRYAGGLKTILSTELSIPDMIQIDNALGSRVYEMSDGFYADLSKAKNYRLRRAEGRKA